MRLWFNTLLDQLISTIFPSYCFQCQNIQKDSLVLCKYCLESFFCFWQLDQSSIVLAETKELEALCLKQPRVIETLFLKALLELQSPLCKVVALSDEFKSFKILLELFEAEIFSFDAIYCHKKVIIIGLYENDYEFFKTYMTISGAASVKGIFLYKARFGSFRS